MVLGVLVFLMLSFLSTTAQAQFVGGDGSSGNPYQIDSAEGLNEIRNNMSSHFILTADIDLTTATGDASGAYWNGGEGWEPIGKAGDPYVGIPDNMFEGSINGNGHTIYGLYINRNSSFYVGLFGDVERASELSNMQLEDVNVTGRGSVGGLAGRTLYGTVISNSYTTGSVNGNSSIGGLVGNNVGIINNSYSTANINGNSSIGGLVGYNNLNSSISNSYATGSVNGDSNVGGLVGLHFSGSIQNSYSAGNVEGNEHVGGLVGRKWGSGSEITNSYWNTQTSGQVNGVGIDDGGAPAEVTGLTSEQMRREAAFSDFDFTNDWQIQEGLAFPVLQDNTQNPPPGFIFTEGAGTEAEPYEIANAKQLNAVRFDLSAHYVLTVDIDLTTATGDASGAYWNGGKGWDPIGDNDNPFTGSLDGDSFVITGLFIDRGGEDFVGLFGSGTELRNIALEQVAITGDDYVGGLVGWNGGQVQNSYVTGSVSGSRSVGGLIGYNGGDIINSYTTGSIAGAGSTGGLTGSNSDSITNSYSTASVNVNVSNAGGLVGENNGEIYDSYATGDVNGYSRVGGLVGYNFDKIYDSYAAGEVDGNIDVGGFVGDNDFGTITTSYWNTETSGTTIGVGNGSSGGVTGLTSSQMREEASFTGFDFTNTWQIESEAYTSYPYLKEITYDEPGAEPEVNPIPGLYGFLPDANNIVYVDQSVSGGSGNSWANAIPELRDALAWAQDWDGDTDGTLQIWVAEGIYLPTGDGSTRTATFQLLNNVEIFGGFDPDNGIISLEDERILPPQGGTEGGGSILSGDIDGNDDPFAPDTDSDNYSETLSQTDHIQGTNSYHVVTGSGAENTALLDGFTITAGNTYNASDPHQNGGGIFNENGNPTLKNLVIEGNRALLVGGGIFSTENSSLTLNNVVLAHNTALFGGGMAIDNSRSTLVNVRMESNSAYSDGGAISGGLNGTLLIINALFVDNSALGSGGAGALSIGNSDATLINATFVNNSAENGTGGAIFSNGDMRIVNSIFWENTAEDEANDFFNGEDATADITNSILNSGDSDDVVSAGTLSCNRCSDLDPLFSDPGNGDFTLSSKSPAINSGTNAPYESGRAAEGITTDLAGDDRIYDGGTVDMGAFEFQGEPDEIPQGEDKRLLVGNDEPYVFSGSDFNLTGSVETVRVISFTGFGSLKLDGEEIYAPVDISAEDISGDLLTFTYSKGVAYGYDYSALIFELIDDVGRESEHATLDIDVAATSVDLTIDREGWRFLSSPVDGETVGEFFAPIWTQGFAGSDSPGAEFANIQTLNQQEYVWEPIESDDSKLDAGDAVIAYVYGDDENNGSDDGFPKTLSSSTDNWLNLDGSYEESFFYDPDQQEGEDSFYLWGNPYPIAINFCEVLSDEIADNVYSWDPSLNGGNGGYENRSCSVSDDTVIPIAPFQSVWLRLASEGNVLAIGDEAYMEGSADGYFKETEPSSDRFLISLNVISEDQQEKSFTNSTRILFDDKASNGSDLMDAPKLSSAGLAKRYLSLHSLDEQNNPYALQALPATMEEKTRIPLDIQTTESGRFTMDWTLPESNVFSGSYFLRDNKTGEVIELREGSTYGFEITTEERSAKSKQDFADLGLAASQPSDRLERSGGSEPRFELLIATSGVDGLAELGATPEDFTLAQNYPNPFNPTTQISYQLPVSSEVRLEVYDMLGRNVATLVNEQVAAGRHTVNFDASNLSSGVYLYRLQAGSQIMTKKLTILK